MRTFLVVVLALLTTAAEAQGVCGDYTEFVNSLAQKFKEKSIGKGIAREGTVVFELFASDTSFTILSVTPTGRACIVITGAEWIADNHIIGEDT